MASPLKVSVQLQATSSVTQEITFAGWGFMLWTYRPSVTNHDVCCGWVQVIRVLHMILLLFLKRNSSSRFSRTVPIGFTTKDISWLVILIPIDGSPYGSIFWCQVPFSQRCLQHLAVQQLNPNWMYIWWSHDVLGHSMEEAAFRHSRCPQGSNCSNAPS